MDKNTFLTLVELSKQVDDRPKALRDLVRRPKSFLYYKLFVNLAKFMEPELIVELGTRQGVGALHFRHGSKTAKIITVDIVRSRLTKDRLFAHNVEGVLCDAAEYAVQIENNTVDICFVDANHMYEDVKADTAAWLPKMKQGGIMLFDDIWLEEYPKGFKTGMRRFWEELDGDFEKIEVPWLHATTNFGVLFL